MTPPKNNQDDKDVIIDLISEDVEEHHRRCDGRGLMMHWCPHKDVTLVCAQCKPPACTCDVDEEDTCKAY